ncbi:MAG: VTT domain-containing protein [Candidatus Krumholzibacteria bacterium]|nr:VTT domain-containing protein [Candidatus Krumholzibacteria bacterium]
MDAIHPQTPPLSTPVKQSARRWGRFALSLALVLVMGAVLLAALPEARGLVLLGLYTIPSHMFVSPFSHEPLLLYYAKFYPAWGCALASIIGCLVAAVWDYWLFVPLVHKPRLRSKYVTNVLYRKSVHLFRKSPFVTLVVAGLTPVPFYPVKFLSIADGYPLKRYLLALIVGRTPRYYVLAYLGYVLKLPNWSLIVLALVILVIALYQNRSQKARHVTKPQ